MKIKMNNAVGPQVRTAKPKPSKLLPVLGAASMVGGLQAATQFFAHTFAYHATLGPNVGHVYAPWSILHWTYKWYSQYPDEIMKAGSMGMLVSTVGLLGVAVAKVVTSNSSKANEYLHGSARWAEKKDIQAAGLLPRERNVLEIVTGKAAPTATGVYVGGWQDKDGNFFYLRHSGPEHVLDLRAHALGQGRRPGGAHAAVVGRERVITDLKGELWALTAGWRQKHAKNKVLRFEPASTSGASAGIRWTKSASAPNTRWATCRTLPR
jgi:type IV secretion system protein VirD4